MVEPPAAATHAAALEEDEADSEDIAARNGSDLVSFAIGFAKRTAQYLN